MIKYDEYKIGDTTISVASAANFIADQLCPGKGRKAQYQTVYTRIKYAQSIGRLPNKRSLNSLDFFTWAVEQSDWETLKQVSQLSYSARVEVTGVRITAEVGRTSAAPLPDNLTELQDFAASLVQRYEEQEQAMKQLKAENKDLRAEKARKSALARQYGSLNKGSGR